MSDDYAQLDVTAPSSTAAILRLHEYGADSPYRTVWQLIESILDRVELMHQSKTVAQMYRLICKDSLRLPTKAEARASVITRSGIPFEFSFTTDDRPGTLRLLSEAAPAYLPLQERVTRTIQCLESLRRLHELFCYPDPLKSIIQYIFPEDLSELDATWYRGAMWLSVRFVQDQAPVIRVYANQLLNNNAYRVLNLHKVFQCLRQLWNAEHLLQIYPLVDGWSEVSGISFDLYPRGVGGVKLYLGVRELKTERILDLLRAIDLQDSDHQVLLFLNRMNPIKERPLGSSLLLSIHFPNLKGLPLSAKLDVTTREVFGNDQQVYEATEELLHQFRLHPMGFRACEDLFFPRGFPPEPVQIMQYVGLGISAGGKVRMNIYLAPQCSLQPITSESECRHGISRPSGSMVSASRKTILNAIRAASQFLLMMQSPNGGWWDLAVSVGSSGPWLTSIVGEVLLELPESFYSTGLRHALSRAADYVEQAKLPTGGWGYNEALLEDCDSTAHSIRFLHLMDREIDLNSVECLRSFQNESGAFLTYLGAPSGHSWGLVHHDVHPVAVRALALILGKTHSAVKKGLQIIYSSLADRPIWPAFWWRFQVYGPYVNLLCLREIDDLARIPDPKRREIIASLKHGEALETALSGLVSLVLQQGEQSPFLKCAYQRLVESQLQDGSWPTSSSLRVTDSECAKPWFQPDERIAGPIYCDRKRIFTTALGLKFLVMLFRETKNSK